MTRRDYLSSVLWIALGLAASAELGHAIVMTTSAVNVRSTIKPESTREDFIPTRGEMLPPGAEL